MNKTKLENKLNHLVKCHTPGLQYKVIRNGQELSDYSMGLADIDNNVPVSEASQFSLYSVTKVFTAIAALQLIEKGQIEIDRSIENYLPQFKFKYKILIRHLINQTSGLKNPIPTKWVHLPSEHSNFEEDSCFHDIIRKNLRLSFTPGAKYQYSNLSYWLLSLLIAKVSGQSYESYIYDKILRPLKIQNKASFRYSSEILYATGYLSLFSPINILKYFFTDSKYWSNYEKTWLRISPHYVNGPGFGGLIGNSASLIILAKDLMSECSKLLSQNSLDLMFSPQTSNNKKILPMSLGFHIDELNGEPYYFKEGGGMGFHAEIRIYPTLKSSSVLLVNSGTFNTRKRLSELDQLSIME